MAINPEIERYYCRGGEVQRLDQRCWLEKLRTQEIIQRYLTDEPMDVLDVGGATGVYAFWLSEMGHHVHLIDPVAFHIEFVSNLNATSQYPLKSTTVGDARRLEFPDESFDLVLMLGPLYHLIHKDERIQALKEAKRVVKKDGYVISAIITRTAPLLDGVFDEWGLKPGIPEIIKSEMQDGIHRNPDEIPEFFTTAYFQRPSELRVEIESCGLNCRKLISVESFGWLIPDLYLKWQDQDYRNKILDLMRSMEEEESVLGMGSHLLAIAQK